MLFIQETKPGRFDVYRRSSLGDSLPNFIFSLTDSWQPTGIPVEYGIDVVVNRIKAGDLWRDDQFVENWIAQHEKDVESKDRARNNSIESFLYDFRKQFQRATDSVNTSGMKNTIQN